LLTSRRRSATLSCRMSGREIEAIPRGYSGQGAGTSPLTSEFGETPDASPGSLEASAGGPDVSGGPPDASGDRFLLPAARRTRHLDRRKLHPECRKLPAARRTHHPERRTRRRRDACVLSGLGGGWGARVPGVETPGYIPMPFRGAGGPCRQRPVSPRLGAHAAEKRS
jgi:hypothetical protein